MFIKLMSQSPMRSISEPEFAYPAYLVVCPNRDIYVAFLRTNFNHHTSTSLFVYITSLDPRSQNTASILPKPQPYHPRIN